jgi:MFS family permease
MRAVDIIAKKRDGQTLTREEIDFFIQGFTRGEITDYQAAAWAMAVYLRGMTNAETTALTLAMAYSGGPVLVGLIIALGLFSSMIPGIIQALPAEILGPGASGTGYAIMGICMNTGIAATQPLPGIILDTTGSYRLSLLSMAMLGALTAGVAYLLKSK